MGTAAILLLALASLGAGAATCHAVQYGSLPFVAPTVPVAETGITAPPNLERIAHPLAILALDVSGSMFKADPAHAQYDAALGFFDTYAALGREVLAKGEQARVAVVLFGTIAQVVDWSGDHQAFLKVSGATRERFRDVLRCYLGEEATKTQASDPRRSRDTDYAGAIDAVQSIIESHARARPDAGPPSVVFMTDGVNHPHAGFSPLIPAGQRPERATSPEQTLASAALAREETHWLPAGDCTTVYRRPKGDTPSWLDSDGKVDGLVNGRVEQLLRRDFLLGRDLPRAPPMWAPVLLQAKISAEKVARIRATVASSTRSKDYWGLSDTLLECSTPEMLAPQFVEVLAKWFRMRKLPTGASGRAFSVPPGTQAVAVFAATDKTASVTITNGRRTEALKGKGKRWGGVIGSGPAGKWEVSLKPEGKDTAQLEGLTVYLRPRHQWALLAPSHHVLGGPGAGPVAELQLCPMSGGDCVPGTSVFEDLPKTLPGRVLAAGGIETEFEMIATPGDPRASYRAALPLPTGTTGKFTIEARLDPLEAHGVPLTRNRLSLEVDVRPGLRVVVSDAQGDEKHGLSVGLRHVPGWLADFSEDTDDR